MDITQIASQVNDALTVRRVFGEPIERNGITIVPVANVLGGGGGGEGSGPMPVQTGAAAGESALMAGGSGGGFGLRATPAGVYVIRGDNVTWQPAMDLTRVAIMGQVVAIVGLLVIRSVLRSRARD